MKVAPLNPKKILQCLIKDPWGWIFYPITLKETEIEKLLYSVFVLWVYVKTRVYNK